MTEQLRVLVVATSYPRSETDWQGTFIKRLVDAMSQRPDLHTALWAPPGPLAAGVRDAAAGDDADFLLHLANGGGIAHRLRSRPVAGLRDAAGLMRRLRALYARDRSDILHINWLQNALPLPGSGRRAVVTVLGTDYKLLELPGMVAALRRVFRANRCILAPNAPWMSARLEALFGDLCRVTATNFGIDDRWFAVSPDASVQPRLWLCVSRITRAKIGSLFDWGESVFSADRPLDLVGPNQEGMTLPSWVRHHGHAAPEDLCRSWFPRSHGLVSLSSHAEGRPQVMLEAMAAGLPIVASDIPAHADTIAHGETGFLVRSPAALAAAVAELESTDLANTMAANARAAARRDFGSWPDCVDRYMALYRMLHDA